MHCHDCEVPPGQLHVPGCDCEQCPHCGFQRIGCGCGEDEQKEHRPPLPWTGEMFAVAEAREQGWFVAWDEEREVWSRCGADHPRATEDRSRVLRSCKWDPDQARFVIPPGIP